MNKSEKSIIYMAQCTIKRDMVYVGKTHQSNLNNRIDQHKQMAKNGDSTPFHVALIDYGLKNWEWSILCKCSIEQEFEKEQEYIKKLGAISVDSLNVTHKNKLQKNKLIKFSNKIIDRAKGNKIISYKKSELGNKFLRISGKLKPVINLKTSKAYESETEAAELECVPRSTIRLSCNFGKMLSDGTRYAYLDLNDKPILCNGHSANVYIGDNTRSKKVKNLINGKIYRNCQEAAEEYNISKNSVNESALGHYQVVKNKYAFCYLDKNGNEIILENHKKGLSKITEKELVKYATWHIDDLDMKNILYFKSLDDLCDKLEISKSHVKSVCEGQRSHVENWRIAYFNRETNLPILSPKHKEKIRKRLRKIICINDGKIFNSGIDAGKYYRLNHCQITKCAGGEAKSVYNNDTRLRFAFIDENGKPILLNKHKESLSMRGHKRIKLLRTGEVFQSLAEFCRKTGVSQKRARKYINNPNIDMLGFEFIQIE